MTIFGGGFGGGGFGSSDPGVQSKLAALKAKKGNNPASSVNKFLSEDLGIDPRDLPYNLNSAHERLREILSGESVDMCDIVGNSMGIVCVALSSSEFPGATCPCGAKDHGYWENTDPHKNTGTWLCYGCDEETQGLPLPSTTTKTATPNDHQGLDWHDVERIYTAYTKYITVYGDGDDAVKGEYWSFKAVTSYRGIDVSPVIPQTVNPDPKSYPSGSVLRLEKHILDEDGGTTSVREYVRVGGLFDDDTLTILATMKPITDLTGWTVVEEL